MPHIKETTSKSQERPDTSDDYLPLNYQLKTMCLAKKAVQMPNKGVCASKMCCRKEKIYNNLRFRGARLPTLLWSRSSEVGGGDELQLPNLQAGHPQHLPQTEVGYWLQSLHRGQG